MKRNSSELNVRSKHLSQKISAQNSFRRPDKDNKSLTGDNSEIGSIKNSELRNNIYSQDGRRSKVATNDKIYNTKSLNNSKISI